MFNSTALILTASMFVGQAGRTSRRSTETCLYFQPYIGTWVANVTVDDDIPGLAQKGDELPVCISFGWAKNGQAVLVELGVTFASGDVDFGQAMYVWDPQRKAITGLDVNVIGDLMRGEAIVQDGKLVFKLHGSKADGTSISSNIVYEPVKEDSFRAKSSKERRGTNRCPIQPLSS